VSETDVFNYTIKVKRNLSARIQIYFYIWQIGTEL